MNAQRLIYIGAAVGTALAWVAARKYFAGGKCAKADLDNLRGKSLLITGGNSGIGKETALEAIKAGAARVIIACKVSDKTQAALQELRGAAGPSQVVEALPLDLADLASVRAAVDSLAIRKLRIDILINNAGVMACPPMKTKDNFEMQFGTNHLGHFALTNLLLNKNLITEPGRIVVVSSGAHQRGGPLNFNDLMHTKDYNPHVVYGHSKLANILFAQELQRRLNARGRRMTAVSLRPGVVRTDLARHMRFVRPLFLLLSPITYCVTKSPWEGAQTTLHCASSPEVEQQGGLYFSDCAVKAPLHVSPEQAKRLWEESERLVGVMASW